MKNIFGYVTPGLAGGVRVASRALARRHLHPMARLLRGASAALWSCHRACVVPRCRILRQRDAGTVQVSSLHVPITRLPRLFRSLAMTLIPVVLLAACSAPAAPIAAPMPATQTEVSVVMGYIPHIQFAPWFVADKKGYFAAEGIKVNYNWGFELDGVKLVGANQADFALLGGDQVIQARSQNIPVVYVANWYNAFPIAIFSLKEKNITTPKDLVGKKVGLPGFYGATYTGWRALLYEQGIKETDIQTQDIGFNQIAAVTQGAVDAAAGYSNNEPVQLVLAGKQINVLQVGEYSKLPGIGLVTNDKSIADRPQIVQKVARAFLRGVADTNSNPQEALEISTQVVPEAGGQNLKTTEAVLNASIKLWQSPRLGFSDPAAWSASAKFMRDAGLIKNEVEASKAFTNKFVQSP